MDTLCHYTSKTKWEQILKDRFLVPRTRITEQNVRFLVGDLVKPKVLTIMHNYPLFTVGIPDMNHPGWAEYGLLDYLTAHTTDEVVLRFPIEGRHGVLVREHKHWSPKECIDLYGSDLFGIDRTGDLTLEQLADGRVKTQLAKYYNSTVPLESYDGSYVAPEIWFPHTIPVSVLTVMKPRPRK